MKGKGKGSRMPSKETLSRSLEIIFKEACRKGKRVKLHGIGKISGGLVKTAGETTTSLPSVIDESDNNVL